MVPASDDDWTWVDGRADTVDLASAPTGDDGPVETPSGWTVAPLLVGVLVLVWLGVHPPHALSQLLGTAASLFQGVTR